MRQVHLAVALAAAVFARAASAYKYKVKYRFDGSLDNQELSEGPMFAKLDVRSSK